MILGKLVSSSLSMGRKGSQECGIYPLPGPYEQPLSRDRGEVADGRVPEQIERGLADELWLGRICLEGKRPGFLHEQ